VRKAHGAEAVGKRLSNNKSKQQEKLGHADYIDYCRAEPRKKIEMLVSRSGVLRADKLVDSPDEHDEKNGESQNEQTDGNSS